jgi:hypothetical protein
LAVGKRRTSFDFRDGFRILLPFSTTYLGEMGLSKPKGRETPKRERLRTIDVKTTVALSEISLRMSFFLNKADINITIKRHKEINQLIGLFI